MQLERGNHDTQTAVDALHHADGSLGPMSAGQCEAVSPICLQNGSGASRQPTEQEIQHMDDLDLTVNLGSLLGPGDSWIYGDHADFAALDQAHHVTSVDAAAVGNKPFQELFSATH